MTADTTCDYRAALAERRAVYEADVVRALLDESDEEREERLGLVRLAEAMIRGAMAVEFDRSEN